MFSSFQRHSRPPRVKKYLPSGVSTGSARGAVANWVSLITGGLTVKVPRSSTHRIPGGSQRATATLWFADAAIHFGVARGPEDFKSRESGSSSLVSPTFATITPSELTV